MLRPHVPGQALAQLQRRPRPGLGHAQPRAPVAGQRVEPDRLHPHPRPAGRKAAPSGGLAHVQPVGGRQRGALEARFSQRTQGRIRNRLSPSTRCSWRARWSASQPMQVSRAASARAAAAKPSAPTTLLPKPLSTALPPSYRKSRIARENAPSYRRNTPAPNTREQLLAARIRAPTEADVAGGLAPSLPTRPICLGTDGTDDRDTLAESYHPAPVAGPAVRRQPLKARAVCPTGHARILASGNRRPYRDFVHQLKRMWQAALRRRSQRDRFAWGRMERMTEILWPKVTIRHPWPDRRFAVNHSRQEPCALPGMHGFCTGGVG